MAECPYFWHLKHCLTSGGSLLCSHLLTRQPIFTPCFCAAKTWFVESVITLISVVGLLLARLIILDTFTTFTPLLLKSSSFISFSWMLRYTLTTTKLGLDLAFGSVFHVFTAFGNNCWRFVLDMRLSLKALFSGWIKKSSVFGNSLIRCIFSSGNFVFIAQANCTWVGLGLIVITIGLTGFDFEFLSFWFRKRLRLLWTWKKSCSSCEVSSAVALASDRRALSLLIFARAPLRTIA